MLFGEWSAPPFIYSIGNTGSAARRAPLASQARRLVLFGWLAGLGYRPVWLPNSRREIASRRDRKAGVEGTRQS